MDNLEMAGMALSAIGEVLSFFCTPLKRKDRLGHRDAQLILLLILIVCFSVSFFGLSEWWLTLCVCPLLWLPFRWFRIRAKVKRLSRGKERDLAMVNVANYLTSHSLFEWEIRRFLLPHLVVFFEVGAFSRLRKEIDKLPCHKDHSRIISLNGLLLSMEHRSEEALALLKEWVTVPDNRRKKDYPYHINNLYHAAMTLEDHVAIDYAFSLIEEYVDNAEDENKIPVPLLEAMMYRYDVRDDMAGVEKVKGIISRCIPQASFNKYLELNDVILSYNKRHHNRLPILQYLDEAIEKSREMIPDKERHLVFLLRMAACFTEYHYGWKEITVDCFKNADFYLQYSDKVALQYMAFVVRTLTDVFSRYGMTLPTEQQDHLAKQTYEQIRPHIERFRHDLFELDDMMLYRKREAYRLLLDYAHLRLLVENCADAFVLQMIESYRNIIRLCRINGDVSEHIRSIVVYIDEYIVQDKVMAENRRRDVQDADILQSYKHLEAEKENILDLLEELKTLLKKFNYDRALAYDTLYAANFCLYFHDMEQARFLLLKFEGHQVNISNYTRPVQEMYGKLKMTLDGHAETQPSVPIYSDYSRTAMPRFF